VTSNRKLKRASAMKDRTEITKKRAQEAKDVNAKSTVDRNKN
jgi:hypothetical protein